MDTLFWEFLYITYYRIPTVLEQELHHYCTLLSLYHSSIVIRSYILQNPQEGIHVHGHLPRKIPSTAA